MSPFLLPFKVAKDLEASRSKFFWGGDYDSNKMSWVKWDIVLTDRLRGGLDIGSLVALNATFY